MFALVFVNVCGGCVNLVVAMAHVFAGIDGAWSVRQFEAVRQVCFESSRLDYGHALLDKMINDAFFPQHAQAREQG